MPGMFSLGWATGANVMTPAQARARLAAAIPEARIAAQKSLYEAAVPMRDAWKRNIRERAYRTGRYYDSIQIEVTGELEVEVFTDAVNEQGHAYPIDLEFGTRFMSARPTWRPAIDETETEALAKTVAIFTAFVRAM
jgi:HK97 gp10 family phage protein